MAARWSWGDLVLLETEINPVMTALIRTGSRSRDPQSRAARNSRDFYMHVGAW